MLNRALSFRSSNRSSGGGGGNNNTITFSGAPTSNYSTFNHHQQQHSTHSSSSTRSTRKPFSFPSLRGSSQPALSKRLHRLIKSANTLVSAHESAARERLSIATQLSEWGDQTASTSTLSPVHNTNNTNTGGGSGPLHSSKDTAISDISDKIGVVLSELGEQEEAYAARLDESRAVLKVVRNTERSVQPSRDGRRRIADEMARLRAREPQSARLVTLEQELVRAEAENLVAEAQLGNVTRQKLKESYTIDFLATIERAEKQAILARHGLRLLQLIDDNPVVPGDVRPPYTQAAQARQILNDAEDDLRDWRLNEAALLGEAGGDGKTVIVNPACGGGGNGSQMVGLMGQGKGKENVRPGRGTEDSEVDGLSERY
ncbi:Eisosome component PIL1-domain-containing protein [Chaetomium sp. MPI-SDFR-AT-0129]|nr:Eisosome component PIL1-domain-containing protein [Chaetomium sp. MPI-SDFR-AT-0129]